MSVDSEHTHLNNLKYVQAFQALILLSLILQKII